MNFLDNKNRFHKNENSDMAIVVVSYDGYSDLWEDFFTLLNKYWGDRTYPTYLANNSMKPNFPGVNVMNCGEDAQWSTRTRNSIQKVKEPYICLMLEDYFIGEKVDNKQVTEALELMKTHRLKYYKLNSFSKVRTKHYKNINYLHTIPENMDYGISLQAAIWEKKFLLDLIGDGDYNAWKFEVDQIKNASKGSKEPIEGCVLDKRNILQIRHGVVKGMYLPPAIKYFKKQNFHLNTSKRSVMTKKQYYFSRIKKFIGKTIFKKGIRIKFQKLFS